MGFFGWWILAKGADDAGLRSLGLTPRTDRPALGWTLADGGRELRADFEDVVARASTPGGAAAGIYVFDSDFALVVTARDGGVASRLIVNEDAAPDLADESDPAAFAAWTEAVTPHRLSTEEVEDVMRQE